MTDGARHIPALAGRVADLATALRAVEQADEAWSDAAVDPETAQAELRRLERGRVLLRAELLRLSSHLEVLATAELQAGAADVRREMSSAEQQAADLSLDLEAEEELKQFLARRLGPA